MTDLVFQPKTRLADCRITGVEALARVPAAGARRRELTPAR